MKLRQCNETINSVHLVSSASKIAFHLRQSGEKPLMLPVLAQGDSRLRVWYLSKNNLSEVAAEPESDTVIIGGAHG